MRNTQRRICRLATAPAARPHQPQRQQKHDCSDGGVDDKADDAGAEMSSEPMQKPIADERADDANRRVADETKPVAPNNPASQPSGDDPNDQNDKQPLVRQIHAFPSALRPDSGTSRMPATKR